MKRMISLLLSLVLLLTAAMSVFLFKEKLRPAQYVGVGLGALALIFINI